MAVSNIILYRKLAGIIVNILYRKLAGIIVGLVLPV